MYNVFDSRDLIKAGYVNPTFPYDNYISLCVCVCVFLHACLEVYVYTLLFLFFIIEQTASYFKYSQVGLN